MKLHQEDEQCCLDLVISALSNQHFLPIPQFLHFFLPTRSPVSLVDLQYFSFFRHFLVGITVNFKMLTSVLFLLYHLRVDIFYFSFQFDSFCYFFFKTSLCRLGFSKLNLKLVFKHFHFLSSLCSFLFQFCLSFHLSLFIFYFWLELLQLFRNL